MSTAQQNQVHNDMRRNQILRDSGPTWDAWEDADEIVDLREDLHEDGSDLWLIGEIDEDEPTDLRDEPAEHLWHDHDPIPLDEAIDTWLGGAL